MRPSRFVSASPSIDGFGIDDTVPPSEAQNQEDEMSQTIVIGMIGASAALGFGLCALLLCAFCSYKIKKNREKYLQKIGHSSKHLQHPDNTTVLPKIAIARTKTSDTLSAVFPALSPLAESPDTSSSYGYCSSPGSSSSASSSSCDPSSPTSSEKNDANHAQQTHVGNIAPKLSPPPLTNSSSDDYSCSSYTSDSSVALSSLHDSELSDTELSIRNTKRDASEEGLHTPKTSRAQRKSLAPLAALNIASSVEGDSAHSSSVVLSSLHSSEMSEKSGKKYKTHKNNNEIDNAAPVLHISEIKATGKPNAEPQDVRKMSASAVPVHHAEETKDDSSFESDFENMMAEFSDDSSWDSSSSGSDR